MFKGYYQFDVVRFLPVHFECESDTPNMYTHMVFFGAKCWSESPVRVCVWMYVPLRQTSLPCTLCRFACKASCSTEHNIFKFSISRLYFISIIDLEYMYVQYLCSCCSFWYAVLLTYPVESKWFVLELESLRKNWAKHFLIFFFRFLLEIEL